VDSVRSLSEDAVVDKRWTVGAILTIQAPTPKCRWLMLQPLNERIICATEINPGCRQREVKTLIDVG